MSINIFYFFFGRGANSTINIIGYFAHQDWLETFCNNGLLGVFILFRFFYVFGKSVWLSKKYFPVMMFFSFLILFFASFSKTMFSMSIQNLNICQSLLLGYFTSGSRLLALAKSKQDAKEIKGSMIVVVLITVFVLMLIMVLCAFIHKSLYE